MRFHTGAGRRENEGTDIILPDSSGRLRWPFVYTSVMLTTLATLILELSLTRIFSVVFYYHFAFLAISIALFGLGAGGVFSYLVPSRDGRLFARLGWIALLNSATVVSSLAFLLSRSGEMGALTLAVLYVACALPFFFGGIVVSLVLSETIERIDRVYFFDLIGAACGCLLLIPLLNALGGPNTVIAAAVVFAASAAGWFSLAGSWGGRMTAFLTCLTLLGLIGVNGRLHLIDLRYAKGQPLPEESFVRWNSCSRIAISPDVESSALRIIIDADASTIIASFDLDHLSAVDRHTLLSEGPGLPYVLRPGAKSLVIGPGGGWDVARALASGSKDVTGVEINPIIAGTIMRDDPRLRQLSRGLYLRPEVHIHVEDGRSYVRRSRDLYQVLQATLVDTWASTAAGAFALSENNLYTTDAFRDYLVHLTDDGLLAFTRWGFQPPRESLRLVSLAMAALEALGERESWRHILVVRENTQLLSRWGATDTVLVARKPFTAADLESVRRSLGEQGMQPIYLPGDTGDTAFGRLLRTGDRPGFFGSYPYDVTPVDDNRPFFFYTVQPGDIRHFLQNAAKGSMDYKINRAVPLLFGVVGVSLLATLVMLVLPPLLLGSRLPRERGLRAFLIYFVFVGVGYILIQVALIQKFVLFLGHPTYALTVIIFSMLLSSGLGSFFSRRMGTFEAPVLMRILIVVTVLVAGLAFVVSPLTSAGVGWPLAARMLVSALLISPAGFAMGMPFPSGLARLEAWHAPSVRWAWSLNAAASVLGSALAVFLALYIGLRETLLAGGAMYLCALATVYVSARPQSRRESSAARANPAMQRGARCFSRRVGTSMVPSPRTAPLDARSGSPCAPSARRILHDS